MFASPCKIARVKPESTVFGVATPDPYRVYPLRSELRVGRLAAEFKLALLTVVCALGPCSGALMA